jgi:kynurenine formamidase
MSVQQDAMARWQPAEVTSPHLAQSISVIAAKSVPYFRGGNRLQNLNLYLPRTSETLSLIGLPVTSLPNSGAPSGIPRFQVYVHGGAWRDPHLDAGSIEAAVAHAFSAFDESSPIVAIASLNYSLSQHPTHPSAPYDAIRDRNIDPAREAVHPQHVRDVIHGLALLQSLGLHDQSYILTGHSAGACLALQAALQSPRNYGIEDIPDIPCPAAALGLNGVYDLPALVHSPGASLEHMSDEYKMIVSNAFGADEGKWPGASPAHFDAAQIAERVREGRAPHLVVLDQSDEDQVVPMNQRERLEANLRKVSGLRVIRGNSCTGKHVAPWEQGFMIWDGVRDILRILREER